MSSLKTPPPLTDEDRYTEWKQDIAMWELVTDLSVEKQGPAVFLSLPPNIRECVRELQATDIAKAGGVKVITNKLDTIFEQDEDTRAYLTFKEFYSFKRNSGMNISQEP